MPRKRVAQKEVATPENESASNEVKQPEKEKREPTSVEAAAGTEAKQQPAATMPLDANQMRRKYKIHYLRDESFTTQSGCVVAFLTQNQECHNTQIGAIRLASMPLPILKDYLVENHNHIKQHGVEHWKRHMQMCNSTIGYGESLTIDDFGMTLSIRTSEIMHPSGRYELGTWALDFPFMLAPVNYAGHMSGKPTFEEPCWGYLINGYIYLNEPKKRRTLRRLKEGQAGQAERYSGFEPRRSQYQRRDSPIPGREYPSSIGRGAQTYGDVFPRLEEPKRTPEWSRSSLAPLPEPDY